MVDNRGIDTAVGLYSARQQSSKLNNFRSTDLEQLQRI